MTGTGFSSRRASGRAGSPLVIALHAAAFAGLMLLKTTVDRTGSSRHRDLRRHPPPTPPENPPEPQPQRPQQRSQIDAPTPIVPNPSRRGRSSTIRRLRRFRRPEPDRTGRICRYARSAATSAGPRRGAVDPRFARPAAALSARPRKAQRDGTVRCGSRSAPTAGSRRSRWSAPPATPSGAPPSSTRWRAGASGRRRSTAARSRAPR